METIEKIVQKEIIEIPFWFEEKEFSEDVKAKRKMIVQNAGATVLIAKKLKSVLNLGRVKPYDNESYIFERYNSGAFSHSIGKPERHFYEDLKTLYIGGSIAPLKVEVNREI